MILKQVEMAGVEPARRVDAAQVADFANRNSQESLEAPNRGAREVHGSCPVPEDLPSERRPTNTYVSCLFSST